jgi:hypothetical protein
MLICQIESAPQMQEKWLDNAAIGASALCLVHCLILPVAIMILPFLAAALEHREWLHAALLGFAAPSSLYALLSGVRIHGQSKPLAYGVAGMVFLLLGLWLDDSAVYEMLATVFGSGLLIAGHIQNLRLRRGHWQ